MGFTDVGYMRYSLVADRYQHIAIIAIVTSAAAGWGNPAARAWPGGGSRVATLVVAGWHCWPGREPTYNANRVSCSPIRSSESRSIDRLRQIGVALIKAGDRDEGSKLLRHAVELDPRDAYLQYNLAVELLHDAKNQEAAEHYQLAIQLGRRGGAPYAGLGSALLALGRNDEAISALRRAVELSPADLGAHANLAVVMRQNESPVRSHP